MPGQVKLEPGPSTAIWNSDGIRLRSSQESNLRMIGSHVRPVSGSSYYTYVKLSNVGPDPIGGCTCSTTGLWRTAPFFIDSFPTPTWPVVAPGGASRLDSVGTNQFQLETSTGTRIGGPWFVRGKDPTGTSQTGRNSFWAWSPDGRFFAVVVRDLGLTPQWWLEVYAAATYTRADGIRQISRGPIYQNNGPSTDQLQVIIGSNLGWNSASTCLTLVPPPAGGGASRTREHVILVCPYADNSSNLAQTYDHDVDLNVLQLSAYQYLHSPCGHLVALVPKPAPNGTSPATQLDLIDIRRTCQPIQQRVDNLARQAMVTSSASLATLTTTGPGRQGIALTHMSLSAIDNAECISTQAATVNVRRVRVTTIPNEIGYENVGQASVALWQNESLWVEFPRVAWTNPPASTPGQVHFCLQASAEALPNDPSPGFNNLNLSDRHFAQRNIVFA